MGEYEISSFIKKNYDEYYDGILEWRKICAVDKVNNILSLCGKYPHEKVLDIGSGDGAVLERLSNIGFANLYSLEVSQSAVKTIAERRIEMLSEIKIFDGDNIPYENKHFNLAMLCHVLEHVEHPRKLIYEAARVAEYLYIEVPLEDTVRQKKDFIWDKVGHINFYSLKSIRKLLQTCNMEVIDYIISNPSYQMYKYKFRNKAFIRYLPRELMLRIMPNIAMKLCTYHCALICKSRNNDL